MPGLNDRTSYWADFMSPFLLHRKEVTANETVDSLTNLDKAVNFNRSISAREHNRIALIITPANAVAQASDTVDVKFYTQVTGKANASELLNHHFEVANDTNLSMNEIHVFEKIYAGNIKIILETTSAAGSPLYNIFESHFDMHMDAGFNTVI